MTHISYERIAQIEAKRQELSEAMAAGDLAPEAFVRLSKEYAAIEPVAAAARRFGNEPDSRPLEWAALVPQCTVWLPAAAAAAAEDDRVRPHAARLAHLRPSCAAAKPCRVGTAPSEGGHGTKG